MRKVWEYHNQSDSWHFDSLYPCIFCIVCNGNETLCDRLWIYGTNDSNRQRLFRR